MTDYYADSSVLVKRHVDEIGSEWLRSLTGSAENVFITSRISIVEVYSAFNRRKREAGLSDEQYEQLATDFAVTYKAEYQIIEMNFQVADLALRMLESHLLRAYDAIQLASAILAANALE